MPLDRSLSEVLGAHEDAIKNEVKKAIPATVTAVHPDRQTVDVQIAINNPVFDEIGQVYTEPAPSLSDVPLGVMRGGGMFVWVPVAVGDSVLLIVSDLSVDVWRAGDGTAQDPGFCGKHTLDSCFAMPCVAPDAKFFADPNHDPSKIIIGKDGGAAQIRVSSTDIELGNNATKAVALAPALDALINQLTTATSPTQLITNIAAWVTAQGWGTTLLTVGSGVAKSQQ